MLQQGVPKAADAAEALVAERETMELLAEFFRALNDEVGRAGIQKKQLATRLGLSPSSVTEMFSSGRGGNKTAPSWERVECVLRFCWEKRGQGEFPGMTGETVTRGLKGGLAHYLEDWKFRHAMLIRDMERVRQARRPTSQPPDLYGVRYSLPPDVVAFTGREEELDRITGMAVKTAEAGGGGVIAIHAIDGMPGVGKTALAVHAAHLLKGQFTDRQLYVNLHAHTPGRDPLTAEAALAGLLAATGVEPRYLPDDLESRAGLWRDRMAGQKVLLVLDNAASSAQVCPLLLGSDGSLVLVTSRRHLGDLPGAANSLLLEVLPPVEAQEMFLRLAPRAGFSPGEAVVDLVRIAGFLPLAISLLARVYARHPSWTLAELAGETRASMLTVAAEKDTVAAALDVSYRYLTPGQQIFFRLLGLHPGTAMEPHATAALTGIPLRDAAGHLDALHREGLLIEVAYHRYAMHDLVRSYAQSLLSADSVGIRDQSMERLMDYYLHTAAIAQARLARQTSTCPTGITFAGVPASVPDLPDSARALSWARAERANMLACLECSLEDNDHARVVALTASMSAVLRHDGPWAEVLARHSDAVRAARDLGDRLGEASALNNLADIQSLTDDYPAATRTLETALGISRSIGDRLGQANALTNLGIVREMDGDYAAAAEALKAALNICGDIGDRLGQAYALSNLGFVQHLAADYSGAVSTLEKALEISRDIGDEFGQAAALRFLGIARRLAGDYPGSVEALQAALEISRGIGDRLGQAGTLSNLGIVQQMTGNYPGAAHSLKEALDTFRDMGDKLGQATAVGSLGVVFQMTGDYRGSIDALERSLVIFRRINNRLGEATALGSLGIARRLAEDYSGAAQAQEQALGIFRDLGERGGEVTVLNEMGTLRRIRGDLSRAGIIHQQALDLAREINSSWDEAHALAGLGRCALTEGRADDAEASLRNAHAIFLRIGSVEATSVSTEIEAITQQGPRRS